MSHSSVAFIAAVSVLAVWWFYAPVSPAIAGPRDNKGVEATITQLERNWAAAIANKDTEMLELLLAKDFNGTSPTAHTYSKEMAISDLKAGVYVVDKMVLDVMWVNVYGDTAVAFTSQEEKSKYDKEDVSGRYHYTDVWFKRNGRWQVVASHGSRLDQPD